MAHRRRGVWLVGFLILVAVLVSASAMVVISLFAVPPVRVPDAAALELRLDAPYSEIEPADLLTQLIGLPPSLRATVDAITRAKDDPRVRTLILRPISGGALWAQIQEIRAAVEDFKTSGKPVVAYLETAGAAEYYVASVADRIVLMPAGQLDLTGLAFYELFLRGTLDKIGVSADLFHIGEYKSASNTFTERGFTSAHREMSASLNRDWFEELVRAVAAGRSVSEAEAERLVTGGPYLAEEAEALGLVDALAYEDQLDDDESMRGTEPITVGRYAQAVPASPAPAGAARVALLYAVGTIAGGESQFDSPTGLVVGSDTFADWVRTVRVDPDIRAVVVRIDSPGGSAVASEVIWRELMLTRDVKPVIVSMGDVAASGGYYMAAPAHAIVAEPGTLTGSIGVVTGKFVIDGALDRLGIDTAVVTEGASADLYSPFRPFTAAERARIEQQMQAVYDLFVRRVADGRDQPTTAIEAVAQGRVWTGRQALERGLVDELGGLDRAIDLARERARLDAVRLVVYPAKRSVYDLLADLGDSSMSATTATAALETLLGRPRGQAVGTAVSAFQRFRRGEPLAILPHVFVR